MGQILALLLICFGIVLIASVIGFIRTVWFISIGYTFSIVLMCVFITAYLFPYLNIYNWLQVGIMAFWATRLVGFLIKRERNASYNEAV